MMLSMTGFGRAESISGSGALLTAEISSINRKQLELRVIAPQEFSAFEPVARRIVGTFFSRGSVQLRLTLRRGAPGGGSSGVEIDEAALDELIDGALDARRRAGLSEEVAVETLMALPGVVGAADCGVDDPAFAELFEETVSRACAECRKMREREGAALQQDLRRRGELLKDLLSRLEPECAKLPEIARTRLMGKLEEAGFPVKADDENLIRELLFYTDKADVTEEITRLKSHFAQLDAFLASDRPMGRSLDFLAQEFFREITTLGNKAASPTVSPLAVAFKSELEKMREQIQNIE